MHKQHLLEFALESIDDCVLLLSEKELDGVGKKRKNENATLSHWNIQYANSRLLKMLGAHSAEEISSCILDLEYFQKCVNDALEHKTYREHDIKVCQKRSTVDRLSVSFHVENGFVCAIFKPAHVQKTDSERWHSIFDENSKLLCTIAEYHGDKKDFKLLWISWATANAFPERTRKELLGTFTQEELGMSTIDTQLWIDACKKSEETGCSVDVTTDLHMDDGSVRTMVTTSTYLGHHHGVPAFCIVGRDVTELTQTKKALASSQLELKSSIEVSNLWKEFFDYAPLAMGVGEMIDDSDMRYLHANPECCRALKLPAERIPGVRMSEIAPDETVRLWMTHCKEAQNTADQYIEWEMEDGNYWYQVFCRVKHKMVMFIARDISEKKMKQEQERAQTALLERLVHEKTKDLQEALVVKTRFLGFMSHEIRTPLTGLLGMLTLMQDSAISASQAESICTAKGCGEHLLTIINDILDFTKLGEKKVQLEKVPLSLQSIVETCIDTYASEACKKCVELIYDMPPDQEDGFLGDPSRLSQVLLNMISNAVKFSAEENGEVVVSVRTAQWAHNQYNVLLSVRDNGIGIPRGFTREKLFEPFVQADSSTSRKYGGTGLGLPICKQIAELMDGKIWFESEVGKGSEFFFNVVLEKEPGYKRPPLDISTVPISNRRIMIVAPNKSVQNILSRKFTMWNFEALTESTCEKALHHVTTGVAFHLILVDAWESPECILKLQRSHPVVIMAYSRPLQLPNIPYIKKPLRESNLINLLVGKECRSIPGKVDYGIRSICKSKILLAEDNVVNQRVISQLLKKCGVKKLEIANNGEEAFLMAKETRFDIILMDVMMPVMDGLTSARKIREDVPTDKQPHYIIALTADVCLETKAKCIESGMQDLITKPIDMNALRATLTACSLDLEGESEQSDGHTNMN